MSKSILCLCVTDNANRTYKTVKALRSVGVNAKGLRMRNHPFGYANELQKAGMFEIVEAIKKHDIIWLTMGTINLLRYIPFDKELIVTHSGTKYRQNPQAYNHAFNCFPNVRHLMITADLMGLGAINETLINARIIDDIERVVNNYNSPVIAHFPSNPQKKGSELILKVISNLKKKHYKFVFRYRPTPVIYGENIYQMQRADIYIDQLISEQNGKELQQAGNQAYEATASGCITITNKSDFDGSEPFLVANCEYEMEEHLEMLLKMSKFERNKLNDQLFERLQSQHSLEVVGNQLKQILEL